MTIQLPSRPRSILLPVIAVALTAATRAEVSVDAPRDLGQSFLVASMGGGDGSDPTPWPTWQLHRQAIDPRLALNPDGDLNGDGRPAFALSPSGARPYVVWSRWDGTDREIVLSFWDGLAWTSPRLVTDNLTDDERPRITFSPDGLRHVVWEQVDGPELRVWYRQPPDAAGALGTEPEAVTEWPDTGRLADVAVDEVGTVWVSYQQDELSSPGAVEGIFVARREAPWTWLREHVGPTGLNAMPPGTDRGARIHAARGHVWVDWVDGSGVMAYRVWNGALGIWGTAETIDYSFQQFVAGHEEIAREMARQTIRDRVLHGRSGPGPL